MKLFFYFSCLLILFQSEANTRIGKWCESDDEGKTCIGYISYFDEGNVYAYGVTEDIFYIATGNWQQEGNKSCLSLTYKLFDPLTETPYPPEEFNFCNSIISIDENNFSYTTDDDEIATMYRVSFTPDYNTQPLPYYLQQNKHKIKPALLSLSPPPGKYALYPLPFEMAPAAINFNLSLTPHNDTTSNWSPYSYVQIGDPESVHLRISLSYRPTPEKKATLHLEYHTPGRKNREELARDIALGEQILIHLAWQPDGTTTVSYKDKTIKYVLPLPNWESYFMVSGAQATFQRLIE